MSGPACPEPAKAGTPNVRARFQVYEDSAGAHFVLIEERPASVWLVLQISPAVGLCFRSEFNLQHLHLIGRATLR